jgi:hypothetical protein
MRNVVAIGVLLAACQSADVSRELGARCDDSDECAERCLPPSGDYPGGFCTVICDTSDDCPVSDSECVDREGGACLFDCIDDVSCEFLGAGWHCRDVDTREQPVRKVKVCTGD